MIKETLSKLFIINIYKKLNNFKRKQFNKMNNSIGLISKLLKNNIIKATSGFITLYAFYKWVD